jgi:hypothetical protein
MMGLGRNGEKATNILLNNTNQVCYSSKNIRNLHENT